MNIGIDLGTSNICCSYFLNGSNHVILCNGNKTFPSIIYWDHSILKIGYDAINYVESEYCYHSLKRYIDNFDDKHKYLYTELLKYIKNLCDQTFQNYNVIITVPSYFNDIQRNYTKQCAELAGLSCIRIINESTSACIAYGFDSGTNDEKTIMVLDIGAGTSDISFVQIDCDSIQVIGSYGDLALGGIDITNKIVEYVASKYYAQYGEYNIDLYKNYLFHKCDQIKINLTKENSISEEFIIDNNFFSITITRNIFIDICKNIWKNIEEFIMSSLDKSKLTQDNIDYVILVGGSTHIPQIKTSIKKIFHYNKVLDTIDPECTVSFGASILGSIINGSCKKDIVIMDISQYSYGIEDDNGNFIRIIEKNMHLPCKINKKFTTSMDNIDNIEIKIFQGDHDLCKDNYLIGTIVLDIEKDKKGIPVINIIFQLDVNNILTVYAEDRKTRKNNKLVLNI